jgi:hypothetical protein
VSSQYRQPVNTSRVTKPRWMTTDHEPREQFDFVIMVSRGEPRRSDEQMHDGVLEQVRAWQLRFNPQDPAQVADLAAAVIAIKHIYPDGSQSVQVNRDLLDVYLAQARREAT